MKPAEFDAEAQTPRVRAALEQVQALEPARAPARSVELASLLAELRSDEYTQNQGFGWSLVVEEA